MDCTRSGLSSDHNEDNVKDGKRSRKRKITLNQMLMNYPLSEDGTEGESSLGSNDEPHEAGEQNNGSENESVFVRWFRMSALSEEVKERFTESIKVKRLIIMTQISHIYCIPVF